MVIKECQELEDAKMRYSRFAALFNGAEREPYGLFGFGQLNNAAGLSERIIRPAVRRQLN